MKYPALGLTLVEFMAALAVAAVLLAVGLPGFRQMLVSNRLATTGNALAGAFHLARQAAVARNRPVTFCPGDAASGCRSDWSGGKWMQFVDADHDGALDAGETVLHAGAAAESRQIDILCNRPMRRPIVFMPQGHAEQASGAFAAGTLRVCVHGDIHPNAIDLILAKSGRVRTEVRDFSGDCPPP